MKMFFAAVLFAWVLSPASAGILEASRGGVTFAGPRAEAIRCEYTLSYSIVKGAGTLRVSAPGRADIPAFELAVKDGESLPEAVRVEELTSGAGELLLVYWGRGASMLVVTVIGLTAEGKIGPLAEYGGRGGIYVADVLGNKSKQIIVVEDSAVAKEYTAEVYEHAGRGTMRLVRTLRGKSPHQFSLGAAK